MLLKLLRARTALAGAGFVAVAALMALSLGAVQTVTAQDVAQEQEEEAELAEELLRAKQLYEHGAEASSRLQVHLKRAEEMMHRARALRTSRNTRGMQEMRERMPSVQIRSLRGAMGSSMADRTLAMAEELELTAQQQEQIRGARHDARRAEIERDAQIDMVDLDIDELMDDRHAANLDAVEELMQQRASLRVQGEVAGMRLARLVRDLLTDEQQETLESNRGGLFRLRGDGDHSFFIRAGNEFSWDMGELFDGLRVDDFDFGDGIFEFKTDDDQPNVWRYRIESDDDDDHDDDGK